MKKQVFLSFSNEDKQFAERIYDGLERHGVSCWMSSRDIPPGADYQASTVDAIAAAELVVLVFSSSANVSQKVIKELSLAGAKPMVAARIENVLPAGAFQRLVGAAELHNVFGEFVDARLERFYGQVRDKLQAGTVAQVPPPVPAPARSVRPRLAKPAIAVLVLAIAVFGFRSWHKSNGEPDFWSPEATTTTQSTQVAPAPPRGDTAVAKPADTPVDPPVGPRETRPAPTREVRPEVANSPAPATEVVKPRSKPKPKPPVARRASKPTANARVASADRRPATKPARVAVAWKPSFNCKYARTHAEHMICANPDLAAADVELDRAYRAARRASRDKRGLSDEQDAWRASERDSCPDVDCMLGVYEDRIDELYSVSAR